MVVEDARQSIIRDVLAKEMPIAIANDEQIGRELEKLEVMSTRLTRQLGVIAFRGEADADGNYLVDHTAALLLLDDQARLVGLFRAPHQPDDIAGRVRAIREYVND